MDEEVMQEEIQGFVIDDDNKADWAIRKIKERRDECSRLCAIAKAQIEELKERIQHEQEKCERQNAYLEGRLQEYAETVPLKETKTQYSYALLSGKIQVKKAQQKLVPTDELEEYLKSNAPEYITTVSKVKWGEYRKHLAVRDGHVYDTDTGEEVSGVELEEVPEEFKVVF